VSRELERRLAALSEAADLAQGRLDDDDVGSARAVVQRAGHRLGLGLETTVVALAGPTGAGKSSLFNALAGTELVTSGRIRPTTSVATAAIWGDHAGELLDWLSVPVRHRVGEAAEGGLVVLDLPDFDSVERRHRDEVDRMVALVDLMVWVVDPQKYADSSMHDGYLKPLAAYSESMLMVLNQADTLDTASLRACRDDLRARLAQDGLDGVPVLPVSALTGAGLEDLRAALRERVRRREAALQRLSTDVDRVAGRLAAACREPDPGVLGTQRADRLVRALEQAAGVPTVVAAVGAAHRHRGALAAGWPLTRWLRRLRPDPLRRLRVGDAGSATARTSLPKATAVHHSQVSSAIRVLAADATEGLSEPWPSLARSAALRREDDLADALDAALADSALAPRTPLWWRAAGLLQIALMVIAVLGALWLLGYAALGYLQLQDLVSTPEVSGIPAPSLMLVGGALAGLVLAVLARVVNAIGARRRQRRAQRVLSERVSGVARELVLEPLQAELDVHAALCTRVRQAQAPRR
jgi:GTP-binding protein EngB required for normal cell division